MPGLAERHGELYPELRNPYVGPRPLERGERLYGRDREVRDLDNLLAAERIILLHSPSGAGKSSLLQAGLLPRLVAAFDVWGPTRVNLEPAVAGANRYALSAMQGFEEGVPERLRRPPEVLAAQTLREYVDQRPHRRWAPRNVALLFDQFEEVLTVDPLAVPAKEAFFDQLGDLLRNPRVWALFVLREDYLAPLDPYARRVPSHLRNRFRIDLLGLEGAREVIVETARAGGREFPAADRLVHDLATMKVQQADGSFREETGRHVEPVQLQVVCFRLWDAMPAGDLTIDAEDLERFGDVTEALAAYYADSVARLAAGDEARERAIRDWFGEALIAAGGIRGQVLRGAEQSEGLDNAIIARLLDTHLVRAEQRAGATWYELAHDRLIAPVMDDNAAWRAEHLSEVQQQAALWESRGRPPGLLVKDADLAAARRWAAASAAVTPVEAHFLEESGKAQAIVDRERRQARRLRVWAIVSTTLFVLAVAAGAIALRLRAEAVRQQKIAQEEEARADHEAEEARRQEQIAREEKSRADEKAAEALRQQKIAQEEEARADQEAEQARRQEQIARDEKSRADEKAAEALRQQKIAQEEEARADQEAEQARRQEQIAQDEKTRADRLRRIAEAEALAVKTTSMTQESQHDLAALLALEAFRANRESEGEPESPQIYNALRLAVQQLGSEKIRVLQRQPGAVRSLAVSPDGAALASGGEDGVVRVVGLAAPQAEAEKLDPPFRDDSVRALAWDAGGLAAASFRGAVRVWKDVRSAQPRVLSESGPAVNALAFQPGLGRLAAGDCTGAVALWDLGGGDPPQLLLAGAEQQPCEPAAGEPPPGIRDLAVHGASLAAASDGRGVFVWKDVRTGEEPRLFADATAVCSVAFNHDGRYLAAGTAAGPIRVWDLEAPGREPFALSGHTARVESLEFHPRREGFLASASLDGTLRLWDVLRPNVLPLILEGHAGWVWAATFSPDGERLISGSGDRTIRLWTTSSEALAEEVCKVVRSRRRLTPAQWQEYRAGEAYHETCPERTDP